MTTPTREIHLASRPFGWPTHDDFRTVETELATPVPARCWCATPSCPWTPTCAAG